MRRGPEAGSAVLTGVVGIVVLLGLFAGALNLVVDEYAKGALRTAVDESSQAGATAGGSVMACEAKAAQVRANLLPGPFGRGIVVDCSLQGDEMVASAVGTLPSLVPPVPPVHLSLLGFSVVEEVPAQ
jgi:hypothetical protein